MADVERVLDCAPRALVDLRSPGEFAADHLPGAENVPLFGDLDRAVIGTLYVQRSPESAFEEGRARTRAGIAELTARVAALARWDVPAVDLAERVARMTAGGIERLEQELGATRAVPDPESVVFYCWRGGLRSRAVIAFLRQLGLRSALGIEGGYRSYRRSVRRRVEQWKAPESFVLRGLTGVGKTLVLRELLQMRPEWCLDLEAHAGHRSSILGMVGLEPASQKLFESRLARRIAQGFPGPCVVEGESRKVGDVILPSSVWRAIEGGTSFELVAPLERRVRVLVEDYLAGPRSRVELAARLPFIELRLGKRWSGVLVGMLESGREEELVELLLERYYDPLYRHSEGRRGCVARFDSSAPRGAAEEIQRWIEKDRARASVVAKASAVPARASASAARVADL